MKSYIDNKNNPSKDSIPPIIHHTAHSKPSNGHIDMERLKKEITTSISNNIINNNETLRQFNSREMRDTVRKAVDKQITFNGIYKHMYNIHDIPHVASHTTGLRHKQSSHHNAFQYESPLI